MENLHEGETLSLIDIRQQDNDVVLTPNEEGVPLTPVLDLPSKFKGYPKGTKINYTPITLGELETLNPTQDIDITQGIAMLLKSIHCNTLDPQDLYYWDVMYIGIQRKLLAFGNTEGTIYRTCPKCGNTISKKFLYTDLDFKQLQAPDLPLKMKINNKDVEFGLVTMKQFLQIDPDQGAMGVYARMIKNMEFNEAYSLVKGCYGLDIKKILYADKQLDYGLKPFMVTCNGQIETINPKFDVTQPESPTNKKYNVETCGEQVAMEVTSPFEVVFPEDEINRDYEFEVQYGN